jgi:putative tricarboxylic transport membrane protein
MSEQPQAGESADTDSVGTRWPELGVAAFLMLIGAMVVTDSLRVGTGWGDDGPRSGYFPFYIGLLLLISSGSVLVGTLLKWRQADPAFAERAQLRMVMAVLVPMAVYVLAITFVGIYLASALLIGYFMVRHGKFGWPLSVGVSVAVPLIFFLVFERWFLVPLPKGPIEAWLGF